MKPLQNRVHSFLRWSEHYTRTDMVYLASGSFWLVLEQVAGMLLAFALAVAFGHFASKDMYGNYKYILSLVGLFSALSLTGLGDAMSQSVAKGFDGALTQSARLQLRWSAPFILLTLMGSFYYYLEGNPFVAGSLLIATVLQPLLASVSSYAAFFYAQKDFARGALFSITMNTVTFLALLSALFLGERAIMLVATYFITKTLLAGYLFWKAQRHMRNNTEDPSLFSFTAHLSTMNIVGAIADKIDSVIVFTLLGPAQLATYTFAVAMPEQIKGLVKNFFGLSLPKFATRPFEEIQKTVWRKLLVLTLLITIPVGVYIVLAPLLFSIFFPLYMDAVIYSQWFAISIIFTTVPPVLLSALTAHKKTKALYISTNAAPFILIISLLILIPLYGIMGAIIAQIIFRMTNAIITAREFVTA